MRLSQEDPISRQALPSRSDGFQSQRQNPNAYGVKNASFVGHYPQAFTSRFCAALSGLLVRFRLNWPILKRQPSNSSKNHRPIQWAGNLRRSIIRPHSLAKIGPQKGRSIHCRPSIARPHGSSNLTGPLNEGPLSHPAASLQGVLFYTSENTVSDRHSYNNFYGLAA